MPIHADRPSALPYLSGFGHEHGSEALPGALPTEQNSPKQCPYGLYAEQLSGTAFTAPRHQNRRTWLYRIRPSAMHHAFRRLDQGRWQADFSEFEAVPEPMRWDPMPLPSQPTDFLQGLVAMAGNAECGFIFTRPTVPCTGEPSTTRMPRC